MAIIVIHREHLQPSADLTLLPNWCDVLVLSQFNVLQPKAVEKAGSNLFFSTCCPLFRPLHLAVGARDGDSVLFTAFPIPYDGQPSNLCVSASSVVSLIY